MFLNVVRENFEPRGRIADRLTPYAVQVADLNHPYVRVHAAILEQERPPDEIGRVLGRVVATDSAIDEGTGEGARVGDIEEVRDVEG